MQDDRKHNSSDISKDSCKCLTLRLMLAMESPTGNNADTDCYLRMPKNPPQLNLQVEMLLEVGEAADAIQQPISTCER